VSDPGTRRSRGRHRRRRPYPKPTTEFSTCPVCEKAVRELASAISHRDTGEPAHFDCILKLLAEQHTLSENEKICYLGKGSFGIVQFRASASPMRFLIRQRIQYEDLEAVPDWRKIPARNLASR
jgi:hypothetical protein